MYEPGNYQKLTSVEFAWEEPRAMAPRSRYQDCYFTSPFKLKQSWVRDYRELATSFRGRVIPQMGLLGFGGDGEAGQTILFFYN